MRAIIGDVTRKKVEDFADAAKEVLQVLHFQSLA